MFNEYQQPLIFLESQPMHRLLAIKALQDGLMQKDLAEILGCSKSTMCEVLKGKKRLPAKCLERAKAYLYNDYYKDGERYVFGELND
ncbi:helix-turn-helix domain-containing protein [Priestia flexa]|uniref:helix-turn-helix domain-containing protein n=1 Tax=Priestia flexa TaxID=86664 RepID=UPI0020A174CA|nr:helix-turn-helix domain-containing protein [Priestia flexa]MCP1191537.1 helix-turn-helix domain-containing protein [Priestia flexa]